MPCSGSGLLAVDVFDGQRFAGDVSGIEGHRYHAADLIRAYSNNEVEVASLPQLTVCGDAS